MQFYAKENENAALKSQMQTVLSDGFPHFERSTPKSPVKPSVVKQDLTRVKPDKVRFMEGDIKDLKREIDVLKKEREQDERRFQLERSENHSLQQQLAEAK